MIRRPPRSTLDRSSAASDVYKRQCHIYLTQGLAHSTRKVSQDYSLSPSGSALPASEDILIRFCCHLADTLHHSSIKVYLSAIRSLHIEDGHPSPLVGCLRLQRVLRGIKRHQGSNRRQRQPITIELMHIIFQSLNFSDYNHCLLYTSPSPRDRTRSRMPSSA